MFYIKYIKKAVCIQEFYEIMIFRLPKQIWLNIYFFFSYNIYSCPRIGLKFKTGFIFSEKWIKCIENKTNFNCLENRIIFYVSICDNWSRFRISNWINVSIWTDNIIWFDDFSFKKISKFHFLSNIHFRTFYNPQLH